MDWFRSKSKVRRLLTLLVTMQPLQRCLCALCCERAWARQCCGLRLHRPCLQSEIGHGWRADRRQIRNVDSVARGLAFVTDGCSVSMPPSLGWSWTRGGWQRRTLGCQEMQAWHTGRGVSLSGADACLTVSSVPSESDAYLRLQDSLI